MRVSIRPAEFQDLSLLRELAILTSVDTFAPFNTPANMKAYLDESFSEAQVQREWGEKDAMCYLAWEDHQLVGFCRIRLNDEAESWLGRNAIEVQRLYVHPDYQGKGIGTLLMQKAIDHAREGGYEWIWLGVWEGNFNAQEFYAKWGFERFSEHIYPMGDDPQTDWMLKKRV